ncbi:MAG: hypothetical protein WD052_14080 [Bacteroidales bacterium]
MNYKQTDQQIVRNILKAATFLLFAGRAWQHLFWDAPFRTLFWDQQIMEGIVLFLGGGSWQEYVTSENTDRFIQMITFGFGVFYSLMAMLTLLVPGRLKSVKWLYIIGSVSLSFLAVLYCKEKFYHAGQFFEYTIQFLLPLFFIYSIAHKADLSKLNLVLKIAIALTFTAHGLYATGIYPQPGVFVDMVIHILHVEEPFSKSFLRVAGVLDFLLSIAIFIPRVSRYALIYALIWGGLTALARTWANFYWDFPLASLHQNLYETVYRLPHMFVPMAALLISYPNVAVIRLQFRISEGFKVFKTTK